MIQKAVGKLFGKMMGLASPHMRMLGLEVVSMADGRAVYRLPYREDLVGDPESGVLHGGVVTSLLDSAGGGAVMSKLGLPQAIATLDLRIDYLQPSMPGEPLIAEVECYKLTHHVAFARGTAYNKRPTDPVAAMTATYMLGTASTPRGPA